MKTLQRILMFYFLGLIYIVQAQEIERKGWNGIVHGGNISIGYNTTLPNSKTKDAYVLKSSGLRADAFIPFSLFRKGWDGWPKTSIGFNIGGTYNFSSTENPSSALSLPFNVFGQTNSTVAYKEGASGQTGFRVGGGPQVNFALGDRFIISPMVLAEYFSMKRNPISAIQTSTFNGTTKEYTLWTQPERNTNGLAITPKLRMQYFFSKNIGIFADAGYIFGRNTNTGFTTLVPQGKPNQGGQYDSQQLEFGTQQTGDVIKTPYNAFTANVGLSIAIGVKKDPKQKDPKNTEPPKQTPKKNNKDCKTYTAPKIINIDENIGYHLNKGNLNLQFERSNNINAKYKVLVWEITDGKRNLLQEKIYPSNFNGSISGLKLNEKKNEQVAVQIQAIENIDIKTKNNQAIVQNASCANFENNGLSNISTISISSSCAALYEFSIDSAVCVKDKKVKVFCKIKIWDPLSIGITSPTLNNITFKDDTTGLPITASAFSTSLSPLNLIVGTFVPFSFELEGDTCNKDLRITYDVNYFCSSGPQGFSACTAVMKLPCCYCNYCDDPLNSNIQVLENSINLLGGDNLGISQHFNISPKNISKVEAELVYMHENAMDPACKVCRADENEVYNFINSNTLNWNSGSAINASAGNMSGTFPSKILNWSCNSQGNLQLNLELALPGTAALSCCERHGEICIRYKFTDIECKTCEYLVCYNY